MSPRGIKLFVALHLLTALAIFAGTLWIAGTARRHSPPTPAATPSPRLPGTAFRPAAPLLLPRVGAIEPDWLQQAQQRELMRPVLPD